MGGLSITPNANIVRRIRRSMSSSRDLVAIFQALKAAGALRVQLEVL